MVRIPCLWPVILIHLAFCGQALSLSHWPAILRAIKLHFRVCQCYINVVRLPFDSLSMTKKNDGVSLSKRRMKRGMRMLYQGVYALQRGSRICGRTLVIRSVTPKHSEIHATPGGVCHFWAPQLPPWRRSRRPPRAAGVAVQ
jgi:hypothetical protein